MQSSQSGSDIKSAFKTSGNIKVWSLLVSVFGDLAAKKNQQLSGAFLNQLFANIGIKSEALRVALHRLRKDGWIDTQKNGRNSSYKLTDFGRTETKKAYHLVYGTNNNLAENWHLMVLKNQTQSPPPNSYELAPRTFLCNQRDAAEKTDAISIKVELSELPSWVADKITSKEATRSATDLFQFLERYAQVTQLNELDCLTIRTIILHQWRRIALRETTWVHMALQPDGLFSKCHRKTHSALATLSIKSLS